VTSPGPESGLLVEIPEAEPAVRRFRERLDSSAGLGVPAHITVLYPFIPPAALDAAVLGQLERLFAAVPRFAFRLDRTSWFGQEVVWLAPSDPGPFRILTQCVVEESVRPLLPIIGEVTAVSLITQEIPDGQFSRAATFPLA
jgi:2'-5' RNA ligase superfamily